MSIIHIENNEQFEAIVTNSEKPVVVDFWAEWCSPCKMMEPVLEDMATNNDIVIAKINVDNESMVQQTVRYAIRSIPTFIVFKNGNETDRLIGMQSKETIINKMV
jgi:thioredoxin 1